MNKEEYAEKQKQIYKQDHVYTDKCSNCGKDLMKRDADYTRHHYEGTYCASHIPSVNKWGNESIIKE